MMMMTMTMKSTPSAASWTRAKALVLGFPLILLLVNNCFAAPANSNEDQIGFVSPSSSRQAFRNHESNAPLLDYNVIPVVPESGISLDTALGPPQQPVDLGVILNYLVARHSGMNSRGRLFNDMDRNELTRKRSSSQSYSRYCAFNAVSCFGRKK